MGISKSFLNSEVMFPLSENEAIYLSDAVSLFSSPSNLSVSFWEDLIMKILFIISKFELSIDNEAIGVPFTFKELFVIREVAISDKLLNGEPVGRNILTKIANIVVENSFEEIPELDQILVDEIDEIIKDFNEREEF